MPRREQGAREARRKELESAADALAAALGVPRTLVWPLIEANVRSLGDMVGWQLSDLLDLRGVGSVKAVRLVVALRQAGIPLPDDRLDAAGRALARRQAAEAVSRG